MLEITTTAWAATMALIVLDLAISRRRGAHVVGFGEAVGWSVFYIGVAMAFGVVLGTLAGWEFGAQYFAGYVVEKSLSVDNLFVFVIVMTTFAVPVEHQQRVLTFGILAALVLRAIFIALGAALLATFSFMFLLGHASPPAALAANFRSASLKSSGASRFGRWPTPLSRSTSGSLSERTSRSTTGSGA